MTYGLIPLRRGSKRIPDKNLKKLLSSPLFIYTVNSASRSVIKKIFISTDYEKEEIFDLIPDDIKHKFEYVKRDSSLCNDKVSALSAVDDLFEKKLIKEEDVIVLLQPTSPLRNSYDINNALLRFLLSEKDVLLSFSKSDPVKKMYYILEGNIEKVTSDKTVFSSQEEKETYVRNSAIYIFKAYFYLKNKTIYRGTIEPFIMPKIRGVDIDDNEDWDLVESLM